MPLVFWLCVLRPRRWSIAKAIPAAALGLFVARLSIAPLYFEPLLPLVALIGALQLAYLISVLQAGRRRAIEARLERTGDLLSDGLAWARAAWPGKPIAHMVAYEILAIYYTVGVLPKPGSGFTHHRETGLRLVLCVAIALGFVEAAVLHLVQSAWIPLVA